MDLVKLLNEVSDALSQSPVSGERARLAQRCLDAVAALQPGGEREVYAALIEDAAKVCESLAVADLTQAHDAIADLKVRAPVAVTVDDAMKERFLSKCSMNARYAFKGRDDDMLGKALSAALAGEVG